jgi:hypothetical protein
MENTTKNPDEVIEVITELTISDIKTLDHILETCLSIPLFADESTPAVRALSDKLKLLIGDLE